MPVIFGPEFGIAQDESRNPQQAHECRRRRIPGEIGIVFDGLLAIQIGDFDFFKSRIGRNVQHVVQVDRTFQQKRQDAFAELLKRVNLGGMAFVVTCAFGNFSVVLGSFSRVP